MLIQALFGALMLSSTTSAFDPAQWDVTTVPGLDQQVNFKHYSGYLDVGGGRKLHYWFMESQRSPSEDPFLLWLNGGPGCSSLMAAVAELGPFRVGYHGVNVTLNEFSWNKVANVLFLESPVGVGFSYDPSGVYETDDKQTTEDNYKAVMNFFQRYPMYLENDFYITGESYAGVYIPLLAQRLLRDLRGVNLKGMAIGNGALDLPLLGNSLIFFAYYHGLIGHKLWDELTTNCCNGSISQQTCDFGWHNKDPACTATVNKTSYIFNESGLNVYNLYDPCSYSDQLQPSLSARKPENTRLYTTKLLMLKMMNRLTMARVLHIGGPECIDQDRLQLYFNRRDVIEALHVEHSPQLWTMCNRNITYHQQHQTMRQVVQELASSGRLKTLIYNGDIDLACNFLGDEWFVRSLGFEPTSDYRMWYVGRTVAGFVQNFEKDITFLTVKGAGHMVPLDKSPESLQMITNFLTDKPF